MSEQWDDVYKSFIQNYVERFIEYLFDQDDWSLAELHSWAFRSLGMIS